MPLSIATVRRRIERRNRPVRSCRWQNGRASSDDCAAAFRVAGAASQS
jgi:hypothetical protein